MKTKTKITLGKILGLTPFVPALAFSAASGIDPDSQEFKNSLNPADTSSIYSTPLKDEINPALLDTTPVSSNQLDSIIIEMNSNSGEIKAVPKPDSSGVDSEFNNPWFPTNPDTSQIDSTSQLHNQYDSESNEPEKIQASGEINVDKLRNSPPTPPVRRGPVVIPADTLKLPTVVLPGDTLKLPTVTLDADTTRLPSVVLPGDTLKLPTVTLDADTTRLPPVVLDADTLKLPTVTLDADTTYLPTVTIPGDTLRLPAIVLQDTLIDRNLKLSTKPIANMPSDTTTVDTIHVNTPKTMVQGIAKYFTNITEKYFNSDARVSAKMDRNLKGLEASLGESETFTDEKFSGVMSGLDSLGSNLAEILLSTNMPAGTAVADQVDNTVDYLQDLESQYTNYLEQATIGLKNFNKQAKRAGTLSTNLQTRVDNQRNDAEERIARIDSALVEVKDLIKKGKKIKKAKGIGDKQHEFKYSGDEDSKQVVEFFQNQYDSTKASLTPELFGSWLGEFYQPQIDQVIDLYSDVLNKKFVNPSRLERINRQSDGLLDSSLIASISEEKEHLANSLAQLKAIRDNDFEATVADNSKPKKVKKTQKARLNWRPRMPNIHLPKFGKQDVSASIGPVYGTNIAGLRAGIQYGPIGLNVEGGARLNSRTHLDTITSPTALGTSAHLSNKDSDFKYMGVSGEAHLGPLFLGAGANHWLYDKAIIEDIMKNNQVIIPNRVNYSKSQNSTNVYGGFRHGFDKNSSVDISFGKDSEMGTYVNTKFVKHFGDNRGNKGSKNKK